MENGTATQRNLFRMGAVVATGELWDMGMLGRSDEELSELRRFLAGFGVHGIDDLRALGMGSAYLHDFAGVVSGVEDD